jgi:Hemopexin
MVMIAEALNGQGPYIGKAYFFRRHQFVRYDWLQNKVDDGYPQPLSAWNLPGPFATGIDAALNGQGPYIGKAYFFRGNQFVRYDWLQNKVDDGYPQPLSAWSLPGPFGTTVGDALEGEGPYFVKAYFFRGNQFVRYDWLQNKGDDGYPQPISAWNLPGPFATNIDAALNGQGLYIGKAFFFREDQYVRYDWLQNKVDDGYPKPIVGNWPGIERLE